MQKIIALDADGVLLDYNAAYAIAWRNAFGELPALRDSNAYWPMDRWAVHRLSGEALTRFRSEFNEEFWSTIPALDGAVEACARLVDSGFQLVCVTAMDEAFGEARRKNLLTHGFPIAEVIVTASVGHDFSPKRAAIERLMPIAFVDDFLPYHRGLPAKVHKALILREPNGSPNTGADHPRRLATRRLEGVLGVVASADRQSRAVIEDFGRRLLNWNEPTSTTRPKFF